MTDSRTKMRGLVLVGPLAAAALAGATLVTPAQAAAHRPGATHASVSILHTTAATGATDPKIPTYVGD